MPLEGAPSAPREAEDRTTGFRRLSERLPSRPPGPPGRAWVGNLQDFEADRLGFLLAARSYGPVVAFDRRTTIINDPTLARQLLQSSPEVEIRENFLLHRLSASQVAEALEMRRLLNAGLRPSAVGRVCGVAAALTRGRVGSLVGHGAATGFDPVPEMEGVISATVAHHYFGADATWIPGPCADLLDALTEVIGNPFALPAVWPSPARMRIKARYERFHDLVVELLRARDARPDLYDDFAVRVLKSRKSGNYSLSRVADLLIGSLLASQRVPAATAGWMLMMIADHPEEAEALAPEAEDFSRTVGAGDGSANVERYPRALATLLETMRLYPATWMITRTAARSLTFAGYTFEPQHQFLISPYVIHRDSAHYERPEAFLPARWTHEARRPALAYLPFGRGRHACPGANLATAVLVSILLTVIGSHRVDRVSTQVAPNPRTTLLPEGLRIRLVPTPPRDQAVSPPW